MNTSIEKVEAFVDELRGPPGPDADAFELAIKSVLHLGEPLLAQMLPEDPTILDGYLERVALYVLSMRSDEAPPLEVVRGEQRQLEA